MGAVLMKMRYFLYSIDTHLKIYLISSFIKDITFKKKLDLGQYFGHT